MLDLKSINKSIMNYYDLPISENDDVNENYLSKIIDYVHDLDEIDKTTYLLNKYKLNNYQYIKYSNDYHFSKYYLNIRNTLEEKSFREQEKIIKKIAEIIIIYNSEKQTYLLNKNIDNLAICLMTLFFIEFLSNKNISNGNNIYKILIQKLDSVGSDLEFIKKIINFFQIIYKDSDLEEYFKSSNLFKNSNSINTDFEKDFLNLIKSYC
jgi:hypothetical protein